MLTLEKNGARSRILSMFRTAFNIGFRAGCDVSTKVEICCTSAGVELTWTHRPCYQGATLVDQSAHLGISSRRTRSNLSKAVHHRFGRPIIRSVNSINRIRDKHPLVAWVCVSGWDPNMTDPILTLGTLLFVKLKAGPAICMRII
jgi:hypothetical protein